jgi:hypothetical protein
MFICTLASVSYVDCCVCWKRVTSDNCDVTPLVFVVVGCNSALGISYYTSWQCEPKRTEMNKTIFFQILKLVTKDYFLEKTLTYALAETSRNFVLLLVSSWLLLCLTHMQSIFADSEPWNRGFLGYFGFPLLIYCSCSSPLAYSFFHHVLYITFCRYWQCHRAHDMHGRYQKMKLLTF